MPSPHEVRDRMLKRLKQARKEARLSQTLVAERLGGWTKTAVSKIERGERELQAAELWEFAQLYGKSMDWFFNESEDNS